MSVQGLMGLCAISAAALLACGDSVTVNEIEKGLEGESCRARNDCAEGLVCRDMVCTPVEAAEAASAAADGGAPQVRGEVGESCQKRADCGTTLSCIDNICVTASSLDGGTEVSSTRGKRGESCEATNDCESGLACIGMRCLQSDVDLDYTPKECFRVQCAQDADCCKDWKPTGGYTQLDCDTFKTNCEAAAGMVLPNDCLLYSNYCWCRTECEAEQCVNIVGQYCLIDDQCALGAGACQDNFCAQCVVDADCLNPGLPTCSAGRCVQCTQDEDCTVAGARCASGSCLAGCTRNEQCGQLQACEMGECVDVGCETDRQCFFLTGDDRSKCRDKECVKPCENDAECTDAFHICEAQVCEFVGCDTDEECRAALNLANQSSLSLDRAVCRAPEE